MRAFALLASLLFAAPVLAADPPAPIQTGVDVSTPLLDDDGQPLPPACAIPEVKAVAAVPATATTPAVPAIAAKPGEECVAFTVKLIFRRTLLWPNYQGEDKWTPEKMADAKWSRFALASRINTAAGGHIELNKAEADVLSKLMAQLYAPLIVGQIMPLLYPNLQPPELQ
jgi:hypothetical protein